MKTVIEMAREIWSAGDVYIGPSEKTLELFAELVRADAIASEREAIMDEWWICVQSDLEHGVKSLNERAAEKWKKEYPAIAGFAATIEARGSKETKENNT